MTFVDLLFVCGNTQCEYRWSGGLCLTPELFLSNFTVGNDKSESRSCQEACCNFVYWKDQRLLWPINARQLR